MDYQTFNSHNPSFGGQFPTSQPTQHAHLQQSNPSFPYGQFPNGQAASFPNMGGAMGGSVMQPGAMQQARAAALQQQQQQQQQQLSSPSPYSSAPFSQTLQSPAHQQFTQNRQTASPASNSGQPYATPQPQQSPGTLASNGQQQPMNTQAPPKSEPPQAQTPVKAVPPSPVSPVAQARNQDRVSTLLEINSILIKEVCDLQTQGKAGQVGPSPDGKTEGEKPQPSKEYVDYMRRLQANLAYLAQNAEKNHKPGQQIQPGPAIMSAPASPAELTKLYQKLQELFPGWKGQTAQMKQSPGPPRMNSNTSQPPNSAGLQQNWSQNAMQSMQQAQQPKMEQQQ